MTEKNESGLETTVEEGFVPLNGIPEFVLISPSILGEYVKRIKGASLEKGIPEGLFRHWETQTSMHGGRGNLESIDDASRQLEMERKGLIYILNHGLLAIRPNLDRFTFLRYDQEKNTVWLKDEALLQYEIPERYRTRKSSKLGKTIGERCVRIEAVGQLTEYLSTYDRRKERMKINAVDVSCADDSYLANLAEQKERVDSHLQKPIVFCYTPDTITFFEGQVSNSEMEVDSIKLEKIALGIYVEKGTGNLKNGYDDRFDSSILKSMLNNILECSQRGIGTKKRIIRNNSNGKSYNVIFFQISSDDCFVKHFPVNVEQMIVEYTREEIEILTTAIGNFPDGQNRSEHTLNGTPDWFDSLISMYHRYRKDRYKSK